MEDRYLFRAKRVDDGKWIVWNIFSGLYGVDIDKSTICQCTGLKDKNGKLIWENDIVRACWQDNEAQCEEIAQVTWDKFGYYPWLDEYHCDGCDLFNEVRDIEVIGNIFDNKELLESEEK